MTYRSISIAVMISQNTIKYLVYAVFISFRRTKLGIMFEITKFYCEIRAELW